MAFETNHIVIHVLKISTINVKVVLILPTITTKHICSIQYIYIQGIKFTNKLAVWPYVASKNYCTSSIANTRIFSWLKILAR